jgi:superoxide dismutase, Cu-Zn family
MRRTFVPLIILPLLVAGCAGNRAEVVTPAGMLDASALPGTAAEGAFQPGGPAAFTYDPAVVPLGATAQVAITRAAAGATVRLAATGLLPDRAYGAHLHTEPCAADPDAAGPHYQHDADPRAAASPPSVDPSYANPHNEVWLDFTTDGEGGASATSAPGRTFHELDPPRSLVLHAGRTRTAPGVAGLAGPRVACLTLPA